MKTYEYVNVTYEMKGAVCAHSLKHREIIAEYQAKGYVYKGYIPTELSAVNGCIRKIDLVFEKDA